MRLGAKARNLNETKIASSLKESEMNKNSTDRKTQRMKQCIPNKTKLCTKQMYKTGARDFGVVGRMTQGNSNNE